MNAWVKGIEMRLIVAVHMGIRIRIKLKFRGLGWVRVRRMR